MVVQLMLFKKIFKTTIVTPVGIKQQYYFYFYKAGSHNLVFFKVVLVSVKIFIAYFM